MGMRRNDAIYYLLGFISGFGFGAVCILRLVAEVQ